MTSSRWRWIDRKTPPGPTSESGLLAGVTGTTGWRIGYPWLWAVLALAAHGSAAAGNPLAEWTERLFGGKSGSSNVSQSPASGVVVLDMDKPERVRIGVDAEQRDFPAGRSRYRELELPREYAHVAVRLQVIAQPNPKGRGNAAFKPIIYILDDDDSVRETRNAEPLQIDIRPFHPTRLLACIPLDKVRRLALATPASANGEYFQSRPRDKVKAPSKGGFYYETNAIKANLPYVDTGELVVEVARASKKGGGC